MALSAEWLEHIDAWQNSGLKQTAYCRAYGLNYSAFTVRLARYRREQMEAQPILIPVQVKAPSEPTLLAGAALVFKHAKGHQLELPKTVSVAWLAELFRCLD